MPKRRFAQAFSALIVHYQNGLSLKCYCRLYNYMCSHMNDPPMLTEVLSTIRPSTAFLQRGEGTGWDKLTCTFYSWVCGKFTGIYRE